MSPRRSKAAAAEEQIEIPSRNVDGAKRAVLRARARHEAGPFATSPDARANLIQQGIEVGLLVRRSTNTLTESLADRTGTVSRLMIATIWCGPHGSGPTVVCQLNIPWPVAIGFPGTGFPSTKTNTAPTGSVGAAKTCS